MFSRFEVAVCVICFHFAVFAIAALRGDGGRGSLQCQSSCDLAGVKRRDSEGSLTRNAQ